ncbi:hypothetical protein SVAN01_04914 [Stagonosporopsis vannaccii]|nr:hypothetical protein SVAN01_04914 [Stagonosporopsis vannaccii]
MASESRSNRRYGSQHDDTYNIIHTGDGNSDGIILGRSSKIVVQPQHPSSPGGPRGDTAGSNDSQLPSSHAPSRPSLVRLIDSLAPSSDNFLHVPLSETDHLLGSAEQPQPLPARQCGGYNPRNIFDDLPADPQASPDPCVASGTQFCDGVEAIDSSRSDTISPGSETAYSSPSVRTNAEAMTQSLILQNAALNDQLREDQNARIQTLENRNAALQQDLAAARLQRSQLENDNAALRAKIDATGSHTTALERTFTSCNEALSARVRRLEHEKTALQVDFQAKDYQVRNLENEKTAAVNLTKDVEAWVGNLYSVLFERSARKEMLVAAQGKQREASRHGEDHSVSESSDNEAFVDCREDCLDGHIATVFQKDFGYENAGST